MPRTARNFAIIECSFHLHDWRIASMTPSQRWVYYTYWVMAVDARCQYIPAHCGDTFVAHSARVRTSCVRVARAKLLSLELLKEMPDGSFLVVGVEDKHPQLTWKEAGQQGTNVPAPSPSYPNLTKPNLTILPTAAPPVDDVPKKPRKRKAKKTPKTREPHPFADAFKAAFDAFFPDAYSWQDGDFVQGAKWHKQYPDVTPEQFTERAKALWAIDAQYRPGYSMTIRGLCASWAQAGAKLKESDATNQKGARGKGGYGSPTIAPGQEKVGWECPQCRKRSGVIRVIDGHALVHIESSSAAGRRYDPLKPECPYCGVEDKRLKGETQ